MSNLKGWFLVILIIVAFIVTPNLGSDLFKACKATTESLKDTSENMREGFKDAPPIIPPK